MKAKAKTPLVNVGRCIDSSNEFLSVCFVCREVPQGVLRQPSQNDLDAVAQSATF
jgi:hypothetical protein